MRLHSLVCLLGAAAAVACGGGGGEGKPVTPTLPAAPIVTTVTIVPGVAQVELGETITVTAEVRDQTGALMAGKTPAWTSSSPAIASIDASSGVLRGVEVGSVTLTATVEGKSGLSIANVLPLAVTSVSIAPSSSLLPGQTSPLVLTLKDRNGGVLTGRFVSWTSSATRVATVNASGVVSALSAGTTTITATSEQVSATISVVVSVPAGTVAPAISAISPATLTAGATAVITGSNFLPIAASNIVYVAGVQATVNAATATQLSVTLPAAGLPCQSTQPVNVEVTTVSGTVTAKQPMSIATQRTLAIGASFMATATDPISCNELPTSGTYVVSVFNAGKTLNASAGFELKGAGGGIFASKISPTDPSRVVNVISAPAPVRGFVDPGKAAAAHEHLAHLEQGMDLVRQLGPPRRFRGAARSVGASGVAGASRSQVPVPLTVGLTTTINFNYNTCTTGTSPAITARVVYVGTKAIVLEDNASSLAGKIDADLIALATEFETVSFPLLLNFGDPLAWDPQTDANGRIIMLFTPKVNSQSTNLLGFVQSCDLFKPSDDARVTASNQAEIFYARAVTDTSPTSTSLNGRPQWKRQMPSVLIHEAKHITAFAERFADPLPAVNEAVWLEEATAQVASELYGRALHGNGWRTNAKYFGTLDCEVRPDTPGCGAGNFVMANHFLFLSDFLQNIEQKTILSGSDDNDIYGSSWLFVRWLTDTYGGSDEGAFLRGIVKSVTTSGVINVTRPAGRSWAELLSQFTLMLATDDLAGISTPYTEASWNLPAVFKGYNEDLRNPPPAVPLNMRTATFGSAFSASVNALRGGGAMLLKLNGGAGGTSQLLDLHGPNGTALSASSNIGIAVLRIQ